MISLLLYPLVKGVNYKEFFTLSYTANVYSLPDLIQTKMFSFTTKMFKVCNNFKLEKNIRSGKMTSFYSLRDKICKSGLC